MNCNSSRSGTNVSCLRSSLRRMLLSFSTTPRAASGSKRISEVTVFSVLKRKCGLICRDSASMRAFSRSCWWRSSFISLHVLFQIFSGAATDISAAITASTSHRSHDAAAEQAHQERAFERHIGEGIGGATNQAKSHAQNQRRHHEQHQFQFLIRVALLREQHAPQGVPPNQECGEGGGHRHL